MTLFVKSLKPIWLKGCKRTYSDNLPPPQIFGNPEGCDLYNTPIVLNYRGFAAGEDSADILPVEDNIGEAASTRLSGSLYPVMRVSRWQLNQLAKKDLDPST